MERRESLNIEPPNEEVRRARKEIAQALTCEIWINAAGEVRIDGEMIALSRGSTMPKLSRRG